MPIAGYGFSRKRRVKCFFMDEGSGAPEMPHYKPGDTIEMNFELSHRERMKIESVEVRFRTEGGEKPNLTEFVLTGAPQPMDETSRARRTAPEDTVSEYTRWSTATVREEVSLNHAPGVYKFFSVIAVTAGGLRYLLKDDPTILGLLDTEFKVVRPSGRPEILGGRFAR
jgi:hypothetical protein